MHTELKWKIIEYIYTHYDEFQLHNMTVNRFRNYIYDDTGEYLIGGEQVAIFIGKAITLFNA